MRLVRPTFEIMAIYGLENYPFNYDIPHKLIEAAGRTCYKSEEKITEFSASSFVEMLIKRKHFAMLEHSWQVCKFYGRSGIYSKFLNQSRIDPSMVAGNLRAWREVNRFHAEYEIMKQKEVWNCVTKTGEIDLLAMTVRIVCDRGVTHELVRHRPVSYAQESTRYCDYSQGRFGGEITFVLPPWIGEEDEEGAEWREAMAEAEKHYMSLLEKGWSAQQARAVLPNSLKTEIVVTASLAEWMWIFELRCAKDAHPQMREIMVPLYYEARSRIPFPEMNLRAEDGVPNLDTDKFHKF